MSSSVEFINLNSSPNKQCGEEWASLLAQRPSKQKDNLEEKSENFLGNFFDPPLLILIGAGLSFLEKNSNAVLALCSTTYKYSKVNLLEQSVKFYIWTIWVKFIN